jgi:hypothetical protein
MSVADEQIFCCSAAIPVSTPEDQKPHNDPNRELHQALLRSFLDFANRRRLASETPAAQLLAILQNALQPESTQPYIQPIPLFTPQNLVGNKLTADIPYCMHLTARHDFGPVKSHRYFMCPENLEDDWTEVSLVHWWAQGYRFRMQTEKMDIKCKKDELFFRISLCPNLDMRGCIPVAVGGVKQGILLDGEQES